MKGFVALGAITSGDAIDALVIHPLFDLIGEICQISKNVKSFPINVIADNDCRILVMIYHIYLDTATLYHLDRVT